MKIKNVVFDIGMVLIDFHWAKTMRELGICEEAIAHLGVHMMGHPLWNEMDLGVMAEDCIREQFKQISPQYAKEIDLFLGNMEHVVTDYPKSREWLQGLKDRGYRVYLLSNYPERMFLMHSKNYSFLPYTDGRVVSYECHLIKPDPRIYQLLCEKYDLLPGECVFLDDREENVFAARKLGFYGICVHNQEQAIAQLEQLLKEKGDF